MITFQQDDYFMKIALEEAKQAYREDEVPVGAVIVAHHQIIAKAHNLRETLQDPTAHAEILALTQGASFLKSWRLCDTTIYVTLEPCLMCAGALIQSRVKKIVFGAFDKQAGGGGSLYNILEDSRLNHTLEVVGGFMEEESRWILQEFFQKKRKENKINK